MNFTKQEDGWTVSTPVYIGSGTDVAKAARCPHEAWLKFAEGTKEGYLMVAERCANCVATRSRHRKI